jgi:hypothetical protein
LQHLRTENPVALDPQTPDKITGQSVLVASIAIISVDENVGVDKKR